MQHGLGRRALGARTWPPRGWTRIPPGTSRRRSLPHLDSDVQSPRAWQLGRNRQILAWVHLQLVGFVTGATVSGPGGYDSQRDSNGPSCWMHAQKEVHSHMGGTPWGQDSQRDNQTWMRQSLAV